MSSIEIMANNLFELERELKEWENAPALPGSATLNPKEVIKGLKKEIAEVKKKLNAVAHV